LRQPKKLLDGLGAALEMRAFRNERGPPHAEQHGTVEAKASARLDDGFPHQLLDATNVA
jgi:hypothetical protein